jgi:hypothetical protein
MAEISSPHDVTTFLALSASEALDRYALGVENFDRRLFELNDSELDSAFFPEAGVGRWPVRVLLGHLADAELAQVHRIRRTVAEEHPLLAPWDEHAFIESGLYGTPSTGAAYPAGGYVAVLHTLRKWNVEWMRTLTAEQWARKALHSERGEQTVGYMVAYLSWHLEHHAWFLNRKIELLLSRRGP